MRGALLTVVLCLLAAAPAGAIVNGKPASEEYPWMAAVRADGEQFCGGTLVRPDWVLTAAHCPDGEDIARLTVVLGRHKMSGSGGEEIPVDRAIVHENFDDANIAGGHDVALLHLARPSAQPVIRLAGLADGDLWAPGRAARVIGWGNPHFGVDTRSDDLMEVDEPVRADAECERAYDTVGGYYDPALMLCAGEDAAYEGHCQGDSGGPLLTKDAAGAWTQIGVVSFGTGCGHPTFYGVFARIGAPTLHDWIAARLPSSGPPAAAAGPPPPSISPPPAQAAAAPAVRLSVQRRIRAGQRIALRVSSTGPVTALKVELVRGGRTLARAALRSLDGRATLRLRPRGRIRPGAVTVRMRARDAAGRPVERTVPARLTR